MLLSPMRAAFVAAIALAAVLPRGEAPAHGHAGAFDFWVRTFELRAVPLGVWPYHRQEPMARAGLYDADGVRMFRADDGTLYDHPVAQAREVVNALANHRLTGDPADLRAAISNADRLLLRAVHRGRAVFFPYPFDFELHGRGRLHAPWFSGMAQGIALSGFVRLWEATADERWLAAADQTFESFLLEAQPGEPWVTSVDAGLLWFEEYPWAPLDHTVNGHVFAAYGMWDYWRLTGSVEAELLLRGALTTALEVAATIRVPGGISRYCVSAYCLRAHAANPRYHGVHIGQYRTLHQLTGEPGFAATARLLELDQLEWDVGE